MSPAKAKKTVGVIGLGIMGGSFTRNLIKAEWRVVGFDVDPKKQRELTKAGAWIVRNAKEVAATCPIVITSLPKPEALIATAKEIAGAGLPPRIIAECSTFTIEDKEKAWKILRKAGHTMLDCPVSGTGAQARTGDLVIYADYQAKLGILTPNVTTPYITGSCGFYRSIESKHVCLPGNIINCVYNWNKLTGNIVGLFYFLRESGKRIFLLA